MAKTGEEYELLVREVFDQIVNNDFKGVQTVDVQHNVTVQGKSNEHQIDVYWEFNFADAKHCAIIEVKDRTRPVQKSDMESFVFKLQDIPNQPRGYYISRNGFQSGALNLAHQNGIKVMTLNKPDEEYWNNRMKEVHLSMVMHIPIIDRMAVLVDQEWMKEHKEIQEKIDEAGGIHMVPAEVFISDHEGNRKYTIADLINRLVAEVGIDNAKHQIRHQFGADDYYEISHHNVLLKAACFGLDFHYEESTEDIHINGADILPYILKDVTEGTVRAIDNMGKVREPTEL